MRAVLVMSGASVQLTAREWQVIDLVLTGLADKEVAAKLGISEKTVRTHIANAMLKLGASNRCQLGHLLANTKRTKTAVGPSGNPAIRQSGNPAIRQSGNPAIDELSAIR